MECECFDDVIFGEEYGVKEGISGLMWVFDLIDGICGYFSGMFIWGVLIVVGDDIGFKVGIID